VTRRCPSRLADVFAQDQEAAAEVYTGDTGRPGSVRAEHGKRNNAVTVNMLDRRRRRIRERADDRK